ncbi:hypothetical protein DAQ1742_03380 [Dickeya aquatica]|uniref:Uncharacterized protein n=1 Tax=Dickeya aquatica TaxID=1401087 RepID=A0A375ADL1_9GAMM|nr:hypothetical protein DAQ1742_03380 [Dickeya aquatica]
MAIPEVKRFKNPKKRTLIGRWFFHKNMIKMEYFRLFWVERSDNRPAAGRSFRYV